jgi:hypothetical protein
MPIGRFQFPPASQDGYQPREKTLPGAWAHMSIEPLL